ncbi:hypothetical protein TNCV_3091271 [Trichonephila clavipes]|uniref:Uncharacterized protein n=1 Tax=Trichonephila clavipes TaxID=2585209 RepID=A0A8X6W8R6_TRICX|nr:hypothetical protein TNCV_3091271 [Trichonephila clavipes]
MSRLMHVKSIDALFCLSVRGMVVWREVREFRLGPRSMTVVQNQSVTNNSCFLIVKDSYTRTNFPLEKASGRSSLVVKVSHHGWLVTSSSPVPLKNRRVGERCTLNLSRTQMSSRWCAVVVRKGGTSSGVVLVT